MTESQVYKQIVENLAQIDDDIARLRQQHLMLRVDIQILLEKQNGIRHHNVVLRVDGVDDCRLAFYAVGKTKAPATIPARVNLRRLWSSL